MDMTFTNVSDILFSISMDKRGIKLIVPAHNKEWFQSLENSSYFVP